MTFQPFRTTRRAQWFQGVPWKCMGLLLFIWRPLCMCACVCMCVCLSPHLFYPARCLASLSGTIVALKHPFSRNESACIYPLGGWLKTREGEEEAWLHVQGYSEEEKNRCCLWNCVEKSKNLGFFGEWKQEEYKLIMLQERFPLRREQKQFYVVYLPFNLFFFPLKKQTDIFLDLFFSSDLFSWLFICNTAYLNHWL